MCIYMVQNWTGHRFCRMMATSNSSKTSHAMRSNRPVSATQKFGATQQRKGPTVALAIVQEPILNETLKNVRSSPC